MGVRSVEDPSLPFSVAGGKIGEGREESELDGEGESDDGWPSKSVLLGVGFRKSSVTVVLASELSSGAVGWTDITA